MSRFKVDVNPEILKWARKESGFDLSEIAEKIDTPIEIFKAWEENGQNIPFGKLKTISSQYKRQIALFFLAQIPPSIVKPKDFRNLGPEQSKFSRNLLMAIRDVTYFRKTALDLLGEPYWKSRYSWTDEALDKKDNNSVLVEWLREKLNISIEDQMSWTYDYQAFKAWRQAVEDRLGILIFQFPLPKNEVQGFCYNNTFPYAIVVNSKYSYTSRIFTIFHELAHIFRQHNGICIVDSVSEKQTEEFWCNSFAGNFLIPEECLIETDYLPDIQTFSTKLKVSREVYLRQLREKGKISPIKFSHLLNEIKSGYKEPTSSGFAPPPEVRSRASRGETFFNLILDSLNQNKLTYSQASSLLDLRIGKILNEF